MTPGTDVLRPAASAFDAMAERFDGRFGEWASVTAQRGAVRRELLAAFRPGGHVLELGGGTGVDALWLAEQGYQVTLTDPSPAMVAISGQRLATVDGQALVLAAEDLDAWSVERAARGEPLFDGAFSNFAPLNCVEDLAPVGRGLARALRPGAPLLLVIFGIASPGEILVECLRGRPGQALRRWRRGPVHARLGQCHFHVRYHRSHEVIAALHPYFRLVRRVGIGVFVPPSAAEPWISRHPRLLAAMEELDRLAARPLALLGDHILYHFERCDAAVATAIDGSARKP